MINSNQFSSLKELNSSVFVHLLEMESDVSSIVKLNGVFFLLINNSDMDSWIFSSNSCDELIGRGSNSIDSLKLPQIYQILGSVL